MLRSTQDILPGEVPMSPPEVANLVETFQIPACADRVFESELAQFNGFRSCMHPCKELSMIAWPILAEVAQDLSQWCVGHGDLKEVVAEGNHGVIGTRFATEVLWLIVADALIS